MGTDPFVEITKTIINKDGISNYLPTLFLPDKNLIKVLEGIPSNVKHKKAAREWVKKENIVNIEYYLAFKIGKDKVKVEHHLANGKTKCTKIKAE